MKKRKLNSKNPKYNKAIADLQSVSYEKRVLISEVLMGKSTSVKIYTAFYK